MAAVAAPKKELTETGRARIEAAIHDRQAAEESFWRTIAEAVYVTQDATLEEVGQMLRQSKNTVQKYARPYKP